MTYISGFLCFYSFNNVHISNTALFELIIVYQVIIRCCNTNNSVFFVCYLLGLQFIAHDHQPWEIVSNWWEFMCLFIFWWKLQHFGLLFHPWTQFLVAHHPLLNSSRGSLLLTWNVSLCLMSNGTLTKISSSNFFY